MKVAVIKRVISSCMLFSCAVGNVVFADSLITANNERLTDVPSNQLMVVNYLSYTSEFTSPDYLQIRIDPTAKLCLYTDTACTQNPRCVSASGTFSTTTYDLASSSGSYSFGVYISGLNSLAQQSGGSAANYRCFNLALDYATTRNTTLAQSTPENYNCLIASTGTGTSATFIGGNSGNGNPCGIPWTQFIFPAT